MKKNTLDEFQAASRMCLSPELLRYMTSHQMKWKEDRKLKYTESSNNIFHFDEKELLDYDLWLRQPWPSKDDGRPSIPNKIREEIKIEANLECALCKSSGEAGEAAHIDPVKTSRCNHPHNLIWLCSNHHKKFDGGYFGPKGADNEIIKSLKKALQHFKKSAWTNQAEISKQIAATLSLCKEMREKLNSAKTETEINAIENFAKKALDSLPNLAFQSSSDQVKPVLNELTQKLKSNDKKPDKSTIDNLDIAISFEDEFLENSGLTNCPLCEGSKTHNGYDCPVCHGDGAVEKDLIVDLSDFKLIECCLCHGSGRNNYNDCPACHGEGKIEYRFYEQIDFSQYDEVPCPVCEGKRNWDECLACNGDGCMPRHVAEKIDVSDFDKIPCPLCSGRGQYNNRTCPVCHENGSISRLHLDRIDISQFALEKCPICKGKGEYLDLPCHPCGGEGELTAAAAEQIDVSDYDSVRCPRCKGKKFIEDYECQICDGTGKILRWRLQYLD